ncbi:MULTISPECIES: alpha,alpha-trehalase [unclassified Streptomyces]|uniref:alpha,alpha-trehalase n=1 Tax=unclassified Streptomyces TaxID=2593676 RepID=UPI001F038B20|nr:MULTISPECIES: alpha,alpha-trehalase [unclassified Streptomyces]MCH0565362.1 hypothetical protein [Streptomyces sp. MUM 2J]MCH0570903.1 hypothetical protein [Streptomyces sp. MUM 136J]
MAPRRPRGLYVISACAALALAAGGAQVPVAAVPATAAAGHPAGGSRALSTGRDADAQPPGLPAAPPADALPSVTDAFTAGSLTGWRTVSGSWRTTAGVLRGSGELRRPLCACAETEELSRARVSLRFRVPDTAADPLASVSVALDGSADRDRLWLTALPFGAAPRLQLVRSTATGETRYADTLRTTALARGSWYRLELEWRHGIAFARIQPDGAARPAAPVAGHVVGAGFHPVAGGLRTRALPSVDVDDFAASRLRRGPRRSSAERGVFAPVARHLVPPPAYDPARVPRPVIDGRPEWLALYDRAWSLLHTGHIRRPAAGSPLVRTYLDEAFGPDLLFQWDTIFMTVYGRYLQPGFDVMGSLDNWYALQEPTGAIWRIYRESDGTRHPWADGARGVNPPLFAWAELKSYRLTGDLTRVRRVLPALRAYADWVSVSRWSQAAPHQLYWNDGEGNGMDNLPTQPGPAGDGTGTGQVDMSSQMVLMWRSLAELETAAGGTERAADDRALADATADRLNRWSWNAADGRYYEVTATGAQYEVDSIAGFWTLPAGVATGDRARRLAEALADPGAYWTDMIFPALAKGSPSYDPTGRYWRGGVWAPTNYAVVEGLRDTGSTGLARRAAERYLTGLTEVYGTTGTLWEAYAPERLPGAWLAASRSGGTPVPAHGVALDPGGAYLAPATTKPGDVPNPAGGTDGVVKRDFVGWTGLGPVAMLIEDVIGIEADTPRRTITWHLTRTDRHGVDHLPLGALGTVSLVADARSDTSAPVRVCASSTAPEALTLVVTDEAGNARSVSVAPGADRQCRTLR